MTGRNDLSGVSIDGLPGVTVRLVNILNGMGIFTVGDLDGVDPISVLREPGCGSGTFRALKMLIRCVEKIRDANHTSEYAEKPVQHNER